MDHRSGSLVYAVANFFLKVSHPEFFRRIRIEGQPVDDRQENLLVVANHPYLPSPSV